MQTVKTCNVCGEVKSLESFTKSHTYCKSCNALKAREWRKANPNYRGSGKIKAIPYEDRQLVSILRKRLVDCKARSKKYGKEDVTVTSDDLYTMWKNQKGMCAVSGIPMTLTTNNLGCVSVDKIDPSRGYIQGNVQLTCWAVNRAKGEMPLDQFTLMCNQIVSYQKVQRLSKSSES